jgi:hypothetical protein
MARPSAAKGQSEWISAAEAIALLKPAMTRQVASRAIAARANDGLIRSRAKRLIVDARSEDGVDVPQSFGGQEARMR